MHVVSMLPRSKGISSLEGRGGECEFRTVLMGLKATDVRSPSILGQKN